MNQNEIILRNILLFMNRATATGMQENTEYNECIQWIGKEIQKEVDKKKDKK